MGCRVYVRDVGVLVYLSELRYFKYVVCSLRCEAKLQWLQLTFDSYSSASHMTF